MFNPSPHPRSDVVRFALDPHPWVAPADGDNPADVLHPQALRSINPPGFEVDGVPARVLDAAVGRMTLLPDRPARDLEFVVEDVPAFGWKRLAVRATDPVPEQEDDGREISAGDVSVVVGEDGCFEARFGGQRFPGLGALEDLGDRGDTYDADLLEPDAVTTTSVSVRRFRHASGIQRLVIERVLAVPVGLAKGREQREGEGGRVAVTCELRVAPGVPRVDAWLRVDNDAHDHRLRLRFPTLGPAAGFEAATTFGVARRTPGAVDAEGWVHPAPPTFPSQGWVHAGGLTVVAPGFNEVEVEPEGAIAVTVLRCVGDLSRHDLRSRPEPAGPGNATPEAQCLGVLKARFALFAGLDPIAARDAELGLRAVCAGPEPCATSGASLLELEGEELALSALKPAESGVGFVLRVLNPGSEAREARVTLGFPFERAEAVRLDETPEAQEVSRDGATLRFNVPAHGLRSVHVR
ncbi:MAG: hypothetical protein JRG83_16635 [Deltaproteobacteria bacterium]|nr:hypothetical protein [Deltaproteobacteria bacterium]